jgi:hypothetical protein
MKQPIAGIAGVKPRGPKPEGAGRLSKQESHALDREYRIQRNQTLALKNLQAQMLLAKARGELIEKRLVELQASFLLTSMRRQAMALPQALCDRLTNIADPDQVKAILDEAMRSLLSEVQELPHRIDAAEWEKFLAEQETVDGEPVAKSAKQGQPPAPEAKAKARKR